MNHARSYGKVAAMVIGLSMVALLLCWQIVQASSLFLIKEIVVLGNDQVPQEEVIKSSGISLGQHILKANTQTIKALLEQHPQIRQATVHQQLPSRIVIEVVERTGIAIVPYFNNFAALSDDGAVVRIINNLTTLHLPIVTGMPLPVTGVGEKVPLTDGFKAGVAVLNALSSDIRSQVSELNIGDSRSLVLYTYDNIPVHLGAGQNISLKVDALRAILNNVRVSKLSGGFVDLTGDAPSYRSVPSPKPKEVNR